MNVIVRLYWQHDLDLVALTLHPMFEMGKWMKKAMICLLYTSPSPRDS